MQTYPGRIFITGASGWLGRRLARIIVQRSLDLFRELPSNMPIRSMILPSEDAAELQDLGVDIFRGDLRNPADCVQFLEGAEGGLLLHTAGIIHPQRVKEFYEVNVNGTRNLLNAAIVAKMQRAVIVSSNSPIGLNPHLGHLFDETSPYHPYMNYGRSKMQMELLVKEMQKSNNLDLVTVRPPMVLRARSASPTNTVLFHDTGGKSADRRLWQQPPLHGLHRQSLRRSAPGRNHGTGPGADLLDCRPASLFDE